MKKIVCAMLVMASITVAAQRDEMRGRENSMKDLTTEQIATLQTKKMTLSLDLNEEQQKKMKSLITNHVAARKAKMEAQKAKKESREKPTAEEKYAMQMERLDAKIVQKREIKALLTEAQYSKWEKMQHRKGKHRKGERKEARRGER
ncbi:hypothetical protein EJ994_16990 [Maribacter sp. MJ134]|uniref:hypothetical protein n=1 Tax=Maribacter sp. MJ134 TaxID=2496865 RepID=UPI000F82E829|nr:hypothetical protein [Maribacter sp. MJ134]AZQ60414.1 hypothetical protein EJ994_16990 [Maribacter sp. MJ134]